MTTGVIYWLPDENLKFFQLSLLPHPPSLQPATPVGKNGELSWRGLARIMRYTSRMWRHHIIFWRHKVFVNKNLFSPSLFGVTRFCLYKLFTIHILNVLTTMLSESARDRISKRTRKVYENLISISGHGFCPIKICTLIWHQEETGFTPSYNWSVITS